MVGHRLDQVSWNYILKISCLVELAAKQVLVRRRGSMEHDKKYVLSDHEIKPATVWCLFRARETCLIFLSSVIYAKPMRRQ